MLSLIDGAGKIRGALRLPINVYPYCATLPAGCGARGTHHVRVILG